MFSFLSKHSSHLISSHTPTFKFQGLGSGGRNMFFEQHGINKKPALFFLSLPTLFVSLGVCPLVPAYHTVRKPVRQTPNKDEMPQTSKRKCVVFPRCRLNFSDVLFILYNIYPTSLGLINMQIYAFICAYFSRANGDLVQIAHSNLLREPNR